MSLTVTATESTAVTGVVSAATVSGPVSTPIPSSPTCARRAAFDSSLDPAACTVHTNLRIRPSLRMGHFCRGAAHRWVFALKLPGDQVPYPQRPGVDGERRIHPARAR